MIFQLPVVNFGNYFRLLFLVRCLNDAFVPLLVIVSPSDLGFFSSLKS